MSKTLPIYGLKYVCLRRTSMQFQKIASFVFNWARYALTKTFKTSWNYSNGMPNIAAYFGRRERAPFWHGMQKTGPKTRNNNRSIWFTCHEIWLGRLKSMSNVQGPFKGSTCTTWYQLDTAGALVLVMTIRTYATQNWTRGSNTD